MINEIYEKLREEEYPKKDRQIKSVDDFWDSVLDRDFKMVDGVLSAQLHTFTTPSMPFLSEQKTTDVTTRSNVDVGKGDMKSRVREIISNNDDWSDFGLRVLPYRKKPYKIGEKLKRSYQWIDNKRTRKQLRGTSVIGITQDNIDQAFRDIHNPQEFREYLGNKIALVKGTRVGSGDDPGEILLDNAEIVAIFDKSEHPAEIEKRNAPAKITFADFVKYKGKNWDDYDFSKRDTPEWKPLVDEYNSLSQDELRKLLSM